LLKQALGVPKVEDYLKTLYERWLSVGFKLLQSLFLDLLSAR